MTVGIDQFLQFGDKGTGDISQAFTPGSTPRGVLCLVVQQTGATDEVIGVDYGGTALTEVALSPLIKSGGEASVVYGFFLGSSVPTGTQTLTVDVDATGSAKTAIGVILTGAGNLEVVDTSSAAGNSVANPSVVVSGGSADCVYFGALHSGLGAGPLTAGAGCTNLEEGLAATRDFGAAICQFNRRTTVTETGDQTLAWTAAADDVNLLGVAIAEVVGGTDATVTPGVIPVTVSIPQAGPSAGSTVTPAAISAPASLPQVGPSAGSAVTPGTAPVVVTLPQATPVTESVTTVEPATIATTVALPQASPSAASVVTPDAISAVVALAQATLSAGSTVTPDAVPVVVALPQALAGAATTVTPAAIAATATLPQASPSTGATVTPGAIAAVAALPQAGVSTGATVTPDTIPVVVGIPQALAGAATSVSPGVIGATVSIPQANVTAAAVASPDPVLVIVQVPQTGLSASSTVTPAVIPLVVSLPQALALSESTEFIWELLGAARIKWFTPGASLKWETGQPEAGPTV